MAPDQWEMVELQKVIDRLEPGVSVLAEDRPALTGEVGVLKVSAISDGRFWPSENKAVPVGERGRLTVSLRKGDVLISRANTFDLIGACAFVEADYPDLYLPDKLWRVRLRNPDQDDSRWLFYVLNLGSVRRSLRRIASGTSGSMKNVSQDYYLGIEIPRPPTREQQDISRVLSDWDRAIQLLAETITLKREFRRRVARRLLTGECRFPEFGTSGGTAATRCGVRPTDWNELTIEECAEEVSRKPQQTGIPVLSCTKRAGLVDSLEYFGKQVFGADTSNYKLVERNQFAYATNHIEEGSIGLLTHRDVGLVSPMYTVFKTSESIYPPFLYALFKTEQYRHIFAINTNSSVNRRGGLRWKRFAQIRVALPDLPEQKRVADFLQVSDRELTLLENKLKALKKQKKGLMQRLLTGAIRLREALHA